MKKFLQTVPLLLFLISSQLQLQAQIPLLSSYPSSNRVLFLDFDGQTVDNTSWNVTGPIVCGPSGLTNAQITEVFNRVSEDYRIFSINVTTDSTKYFGTSYDKRIRVIVTNTNWYNPSAGGVSDVGSFGNIDDSPCFVFSQSLNLNSKKVTEAISHEAGHSLGLYHQVEYLPNCTKVGGFDYHAGYGTGEISWAPIMGLGYDRNMTVWNNGPNSYGCSVFQNDITKILTNPPGESGHPTLRTDEFAATFAGASVAPFSNNQFIVNGIVGRTLTGDSTDQDMFQFTTSTLSRFQLNAIPYNVGTGNLGSDLDMQITLYNASQTQLNVYNPGTLLSSVIDTTLAIGTYYLKVEGKGNIYAPAYGSLGSYSLQGITGLAVLPLRRLELRGAINNDQHQLSWIIDADEQIIKQLLEVSTDGRNFTTLNDAANAIRNYSYHPANGSTVQYRLNVTFDNGRQYYSNVVTLKNTGLKNRPQLISNFITGSSVEVSSPGNYKYEVFDYNGKAVASGLLTSGSNTIRPAGITTGGMYIIRFSNGDAEQWMDKFIKQ